MVEAVIFDMDGVLIDTVESAYAARKAVLGGYGVNISDIPDPHEEAHKGVSAVQLLSAVKEYCGIDIDRDEYLQKIVVKMSDSLVGANATADPELVQLLETLKNNQIPLAIATSSSKMSADMKLRILKVEHFFDAIITADDVSEHKPSPAPYLAAIDRLGVEAVNCVVIEDSAAGVKSGLAASAIVMGFNKYNADKSSLEGTVTTIDSWNKITLERLNTLAVT